jgi:hypothetical protein
MCMLLLYFLHTLAHLICCINLIYGSIVHLLDHMHAEPELEPEFPVEQAPTEETNLALE